MSPSINVRKGAVRSFFETISNDWFFEKVVPSVLQRWVKKDVKGGWKVSEAFLIATAALLAFIYAKKGSN